MGWFKKDPLQIIPFATYGTKSHMYLRGRALEDEDIDLDKKGWLDIILNSWKRFETDEIRQTPLVLSAGKDIRLHTTTDAEGYYLVDEASSDLSAITDREGWLDYQISYNATKQHRIIQCNNRFMGKMLIPNASAAFGVISDIDDTILHTGVASPLKWRVVVNTFFKTPHKRKALEGASEFYGLLHEGRTQKEANPIFYVSNSPWNLYRYLDAFLKRNNFPRGPILLRDFRTPFDRTPRTELAHKYHEIYNILKTYPGLNFILIGDCGEKDAFIYLDVVKQFPGRIVGIYLRAVEHKRKMKRISRLFENYSEVPVLIVEKAEDALAHARLHAFIQ